MLFTLKRAAATIPLAALAISVVFAFKMIRKANPITVNLKHSDFYLEASYGPAPFGFHLGIHGFKSIEQSLKTKQTDDATKPNQSDDATSDQTTFTIQEEGEDYSRPVVLKGKAFRAVTQKPNYVVLISKPVAETNDFWVACKATDARQKWSGCRAGLTVHEEELSFCAAATGGFPLKITYIDSLTTTQSRTFSQVQCFRILTDGPLNISATEGFETTEAFQVELQSEKPFITSSTQDPIKLDTKPMDLNKREVKDLKIGAGEDLDRERSNISWSLRSIPGDSSKYHFEASSPNTSFLAADDEQLLWARLSQDFPSHLGPYEMQEIHGKTIEIPFSIHDQQRATDLSRVTITSNGLTGVAKVRFHGAFFVPAAQDFLKKEEPLYQKEFLLRVTEGMVGILKDKGLLDQETQKMEPEQIRDLLFFGYKRGRDPSQKKSTDLFGKIQTIEFEPYLESASRNEKNQKVSEVLTQMLSWLRQQGESEYEVPSVAAQDDYPVVMGLQFMDNIIPDVYPAQMVITGNLAGAKASEIPFKFEVRDAWTFRWLIIWDLIKILLGAIGGGLFAYWLKSKQDAKESSKTEMPETSIAEVASDPAKEGSVEVKSLENPEPKALAQPPQIREN